MDDSIREALIAVFREELIKKKTIEVDDLGTFKTVHIKQYQKQDPNGDLVLMPPKDYILFTPQNK